MSHLTVKEHSTLKRIRFYLAKVPRSREKSQGQGRKGTRASPIPLDRVTVSQGVSDTMKSARTLDALCRTNCRAGSWDWAAGDGKWAIP